MSTPTPTIHVVDDDDSVRKALMRLLGAAGYEVRGYASAGAFLLSKTGDAPGCVILDVRMPGLSGLDLQSSLAKSGDALPIIFLTGHGDIPMSVGAMKAGAVDFLTKPAKRDAILLAVQNALARDRENRANRGTEMALHSHFEALTPREQSVFAQVVAGKLNKQIATDLGVSERTVKAHRAQVMEKLQATSLAELVHIAERLSRR
jgi:FixJ family two-component response regulator